MDIKSIDAFIGCVELMRQYQKETLKESRKMAVEWEKIIDKFISDWKENGVNGSTELRRVAAIRKRI
jgi:hypothetical protein